MTYVIVGSMVEMGCDAASLAVNVRLVIRFLQSLYLIYIIKDNSGQASR